MMNANLRTQGAGKVALVTGGGQGIGRGIAEELHARGYSVHVIYHSEGKREGALSLVGPDCAHRAELTDPSEAKRVVEAVIQKEGRLDVVVHAVGPYRTAALSKTSAADFHEMLEGNLFTALHVIAAAREAVRQSKGAWLFFGCAGLERWRARAVTTAYISAKAALLVTMRGMSLEEAPHGVTVNMISPGFVPHAGAAADTLSDELYGKIPLGRPAAMGEVTSAAAFLVSEDAGHMVGQNIEIAGGWML